MNAEISCPKNRILSWVRGDFETVNRIIDEKLFYLQNVYVF